ncbi:MAG: aspartate kinase, partial [Tissierellia bacterium]|nr:aspartate kinase [Tissierellia bacterium]
MRIIVQKFGGTSLINEERRNHAIKKVENAIKNDLKPVIVVSAIGRKGDPYATDTLINMVKSVGVDPNLR